MNIFIMIMREKLKLNPNRILGKARELSLWVAQGKK
jgi:hypothetical protein